jgi:hypothetical protein
VFGVVKMETSEKMWCNKYKAPYDSYASFFLSFFLLNVAPGRVSCITHWLATLLNSIRIIGTFNTVTMQDGGSCGRTYKQSMAIEFRTVEGANPIEIHRRLRSVNGEDAIDVSSVERWVSLFKNSEKT